MKRWKVVRTVDDVERNWSLGYPTRKAASAAARRLNGVRPAPPSLHFRVAPMTPEDWALMSELENPQD